MAKTSREYWTEREERHRKSLVRDEKKLASEINDTYARMIREANNQIAEWYQKYATKEGITLAEAKRRVSSLDIKEYSEKAKQYVKDRDMSEQANQEMRLYNLTMKVNRLELLKSEIGMHMAGGFNDIEKIIGVGLTEEARAEMRRQAGILGHTVLHNERAAKVIANSSFKNATFSDRIWQHQDMLKTELDRALQRGLIQGKNPRVLAKDIRKIFGASQKNAERLMITEMARAQIEAQKASYGRNGYEEYMYIACGASDCCDECASLDGQVFPVKDMQPGVNAPPMHPYCHCSTAAYVDEEKYRRMLDEAAEQNRRAREAEQMNNRFVASKNQIEAEKYLKGRLGFIRAKYKGMSLEAINETNRAIAQLYQRYPQLKGFIQTVEVDDNCSGVASFSVKCNKGQISTILTLNPNDLSDLKAISKLIEKNVSSKEWTSKRGIKGILEHEFGHAIEAQRTFAECGLDPFSKDVNTKIDRVVAFKRYQRHEIASRELTKAFANSNIILIEDNIKKYISGYATEDYAEAFAEAVSDNKPNEVTGFIQNEIKRW